MKRIALTLLALPALAASAPSAQACRVFLAPQQRLTMAYARYPDMQVALVRITDARSLTFAATAKLREQAPGYPDPWRATASVTRVIRGEWSPELLVFDRGWGSAACDDGTRIPDVGAEWIIYYRVGKNGEASVMHSYPRNVAITADPRLPLLAD